MKIRRVPHLIALCFLAALIPGPGRVCAYDAPDFDAEVFSADGIFLPDEQQSSLLEALAAIASNFPGNPRVDDDLREKALAIALRLDPMHYNSRLAHRELVKGTAPVATAYFDSLTVVSETLWNLAAQLSRPPLQPDGVRLASYLMELSLIIHPEPTSERLELYATATGGNFPQWEKFITLQPEGNRSTTRTISLRSEVNALQKNRKSGGAPATTRMTGGAPAPGIPAPQPSGTTPDTPIATSLTVVSSVVEVDGTPIAGRVSLMVRPPQNRIERNLIAGASGSSPTAPGLPLIASNEDVPVEEVRIPPGFATEHSWTWPAGSVGELGFTPSGSSPSRRPATPPNVMPQAAVLVGSVLGKAAINEEFILSGEISDPASAPVLRDPLATLRAAGTFGKKYLLMPASALEALVTALQQTGQLSPLFETELVSYSSLGEAIALATSPTDPALIEATAGFAEIEAVSTRMSFPDLARNAKVQERLDGILAKYPGHLSARAMLEFGRRPVSEEMKISQFVGQIDTLVQPFIDLEAMDDINTSKAKIAEAERQLAQLRLEVPAEGRALIPPLEDFIEAAGLYLGLSNRNTTIAFQRLREATTALEELKSGIAPLGGTMDSLTEIRIIEGESLIAGSRVTGGNTSALELTGLPESWSGDHQFWWTGGNPGDTCTLTLEEISAGSRKITLHMTSARDYAIARISVGNLFKEVDFYSREMRLGEPLVFENVEIANNEVLEIEFQIIGRNPDAEPSFFLGLDRIEVQ